jgi:hypothetical protein
MAWAHRGGLAGVAVLFAVLIGAVTWLWFQLTWTVDGDFLLAALLAVPMLSTVNLHWLARPHVWGWGFLLIAVIWAERGAVLTSGRAAAIAALSILWTNFHASFFLLPLIFALYALGQHAEAAWFGRVSHARGYWGLAAVATVATLVNPYGWHVHAHIYQYLTNSALLDRIGEFQSFNFHADGAAQIVATLLIAAAGATLALCEGRLARAALAFGLLFLALRSARGLPLVALVALPFANAALRRAGTQLPWRPSLRQSLAALQEYSANLRALDRRFRGWALTLPAVALLCAAATRAEAGFPPREFPVQAASAVAPLPPDARLLAPDKFGGYLIYRFNGQRPVYFDGRSDFYGVDFMKDYIRLVEVRPGWDGELRRHGFTHALLPVQYSLIPALRQLGWRELYRDEVAVLLAP